MLRNDMKKTGKAVLAFPPGLQFMQPPPDEIPKQRSLDSIRRRLRLRSFLRILRMNLLSPFFSARATFGYIVAILSALLALVFLDDKDWNGRSNTLVLGAVSFALATAFWILASIVRAPFMARAEERKLGNWEGSRFVFAQPQHVYTKGWKPEDNGKIPLFFARGLYPDVLVDYKIEIEGPAQRLNCCVLGAYYFILSTTC